MHNSLELQIIVIAALFKVAQLGDSIASPRGHRLSSFSYYINFSNNILCIFDIFTRKFNI